jgi:hypothetical protein
MRKRNEMPMSVAPSCLSLEARTEILDRVGCKEENGEIDFKDLLRFKALWFNLTPI